MSGDNLLLVKLFTDNKFASNLFRARNKDVVYKYLELVSALSAEFASGSLGATSRAEIGTSAWSLSDSIAAGGGFGSSNIFTSVLSDAILRVSRLGSSDFASDTVASGSGSRSANVFSGVLSHNGAGMGGLGSSDFTSYTVSGRVPLLERRLNLVGVIRKSGSSGGSTADASDNVDTTTSTTESFKTSYRVITSQVSFFVRRKLVRF